MKKERRYNVWAGNPKGSPEDKTRCIAEVHESGRSVLFRQCQGKRGSDDLCAVHRRQKQLGRYLMIPEARAR